ncbi:MAG: hypothetical protein EZS28_024868 [Streblomastix strix]|uniref:Ubiquitin-like domain-containing protein n=1 Tax=Streblomastix strix TaxID=222440 RepID=A0A5J4VAQ8_9EUKA|nr:MAG: hypothetical protein EZS28_024868 [Streblomastix strix]
MYEGVYLRSDKTLIFYKIQDQAILHLVVRVLGTMKVIVKLQTGEELDYEVNPKDKVSDFLDDIKVDIDLEGGYHAFIFKGNKTPDYGRSDALFPVGDGGIGAGPGYYGKKTSRSFRPEILPDWIMSESSWFVETGTIAQKTC